MQMDREKYFRCKKCKHLIRFNHWNIEKERSIIDMLCPHCNAKRSLSILRKRPYYRNKLTTYLSIVVHRNGDELVLSK